MSLSGMPRKRGFLLILCISIVIAIAVIGVGVAMGDRDHSEPIAWINGEPIDVREFQLIADQNRAMVVSYFQKRYGTEVSEGYWSKEINGESPIEMLANETMKTLTNIKVQQLWAKKEGLIADVNYNTFLNDWEAENKTRKENVKNGKVIYGPVEYQMNDYYEYVFSNLIHRLKGRLGNTSLAPTGEQLKLTYERNKSLYKEEATVRVGRLLIQSQISLDQVKRLLSEGIDLKEITTNLPKGISDVSFMEITVGGGSKDDSEMNTLVTETALKLKAGEISTAQKISNGWLIVKSEQRTEANYKSLAEVQGDVLARYVDESYQQELERRIREAQVVRNQKMFNQFMKQYS